MQVTPPSAPSPLAAPEQPASPSADGLGLASLVNADPAAPRASTPLKATAPAAADAPQGLIAFVGDVALAATDALRGRAALRGTGFLALLDQAGPRCLPIVALTSALTGLMLAYMGGAQLSRMGAQAYIADVVTVGMVRELAALMTGIILAGRVGSAFAAQLATMQANEEIDALRTLGVEPAQYLVLPRMLAMLVMAPLLLGLAMLAGVLASVPAATLAYGVPLPEYLGQCARAVTWTHLWIGLAKGTLYAGLVALAGCMEGLNAGRNAQAVGEATTRAVVKALVWIVAAACLSTIVLTSLGY